MRIVRFSTFDELLPYAEQWDRINQSSPGGGVPFRSWDWASTWWQYYGAHWHASRSLFVLAAFDDLGNLAGLAPWYVERSIAFGRVLRFLGCGEVCSEHLDLIVQAGRENEVAAALADWLTVELAQEADLLELAAVDAEGSRSEKLFDFIGGSTCTIHRGDADPCWRIDLPPSVDEYLTRLSKHGRNAFRRIERRMLDSGRAVLKTADNVDEMADFMEILIDLHRQRFLVNGRQTSNCTDRFWNFQRDVALRLFRAGNARVHILDIDGLPAAAEYHFSAGNSIYAYQSGIDPRRLDISPGVVAMVAVIRWAIANGYGNLDLLRGNESYKTHWRAEPQRCVNIRIVPGRIAPQLRHNVWLAGTNTYNWIKEVIK